MVLLRLTQGARCPQMLQHLLCYLFFLVHDVDPVQLCLQLLQLDLPLYHLFLQAPDALT